MRGDCAEGGVSYPDSCGNERNGRASTVESQPARWAGEVLAKIWRTRDFRKYSGGLSDAATVAGKRFGDLSFDAEEVAELIDFNAANRRVPFECMKLG